MLFGLVARVSLVAFNLWLLVCCLCVMVAVGFWWLIL